MAVQIAAQWGDAAPSNLQYVLTTRAAASRTYFPGLEVDPDASVYVITMQGNFAYRGPGIPDNFAPPRPTGLTLVFDAQNAEVLALGGAALDLRPLGRPAPLGRDSG
jgi:hypothetical protein